MKLLENLQLLQIKLILFTLGAELLELKMGSQAHGCRYLARLGRAHCYASHAAYALCRHGSHVLALYRARGAVLFADAAADAFFRCNRVQRQSGSFFLGIAGVAGHFDGAEAVHSLELFDKLVDLRLVVRGGLLRTRDL